MMSMVLLLSSHHVFSWKAQVEGLWRESRIFLALHVLQPTAGQRGGLIDHSGLESRQNGSYLK